MGPASPDLVQEATDIMSGTICNPGPYHKAAPATFRKIYRMKRFMTGVATAAMILACASAATAQHGHGNQGNHGDQGDHGDQGNGHGNHGNRGNNGEHRGWGQDRGRGYHWNRGQRLGYNDWNNGQVLDYRAYHLRYPPPGYQWRAVNGQYILASTATGLIASVLLGR